MALKDDLKLRITCKLDLSVIAREPGRKKIYPNGKNFQMVNEFVSPLPTFEWQPNP